MDDTDAQTGPTRRILTWLRAGYPTGVPRTDYVALLSVLHHRLGAEEIESIASDLSAASDPDAPISEQEIIAGIREHTQQRPDDEDVRRVRAHLAMGGWPLESVEEEVAHETTPDEQPATEDEDDPDGEDHSDDEDEDEERL